MRRFPPTLVSVPQRNRKRPDSVYVAAFDLAKPGAFEIRYVLLSGAVMCSLICFYVCGGIPPHLYLASGTSMHDGSNYCSEQELFITCVRIALLTP